MPLKTLNVQDSSGPYPACPFCLTRIVDSQPESSKSENQGESHSPKEKKNKNKEKPEACHYHLGYLSERQGNQQIPDDCMVCKGVIECMLQKMKTSQT